MRRFSLLLGPALLIAMLLVDPPGQLSLAAWRTAALLALMVIWWLAEPIPLAATALIPFAALPLLGVEDRGGSGTILCFPAGRAGTWRRAAGGGGGQGRIAPAGGRAGGSRERR
jgi:Sodium:sulfate symporter transmembrane region